MERGALAGLVEEPQVIAQVYAAIEKAVTESFDRDQGALIVMPGRVTQAEVKRRANICLDIFKVLRGDMKWSWQRAIDHVPQYLRLQLEGQAWEPSARAAWAPSTT